MVVRLLEYLGVAMNYLPNDDIIPLIAQCRYSKGQSYTVASCMFKVRHANESAVAQICMLSRIIILNYSEWSHM